MMSLTVCEPKTKGNMKRKLAGIFLGGTTRKGMGCMALAGGLMVLCGCHVLTYTGPNGERFARASFGTTIAINSLTLEGDTNGLRRVELKGYQNDSTQALGTVTEAVVRAALSAPK